MDPAKQNYIAVCALADKLFGRIREMVASQLVPTTLKVPRVIKPCILDMIVCSSAVDHVQLPWRSGAQPFVAQLAHNVSLNACQLVCDRGQVALVEPLSAQLGVELGTSLFACKDDVFMGMFTDASSVCELEARRDACAQRWAGLVKCKDEFGELARCL